VSKVIRIDTDKAVRTAEVDAAMQWAMVSLWAESLNQRPTSCLDHTDCCESADVDR
jgi:hypothetical protein